MVRCGHLLNLGIVTLAAAVISLIPRHASAQLRTAVEVRSLDSETAESGKKVDLEGVVIFSDPPSTVFIQDDTAGAFFRLEGADAPRPGDRVRVRGKTFPGLYLPGIEEADFEILGHPGLPEASPVTVDDLMSGRFHYQRVEVRGIVRTVSADGENGSLVRVSTGSRIVEVSVEKSPEDPATWIDSEVLVRGLVAGQINARRQLVASYLRCSDWDEIELIKRGPAEEDVPKVSAPEFLRFDVAGQAGHRVRVAGTVLANFRGGMVFLRDGESALGISMTEFDPSLTPGDTVGMIGFPRMDEFSASLVDASVLAHEPDSSQPLPREMSFPELMKGTGDSDLISTEGVMVDHYRAGKNAVIVLREGAGNLQVRVPELPSNLLVGSTVRVVGICRVDAATGSTYQSMPESISIQMRTLADLEILRAPAWWTPQRLIAGLIALLVIVAAAALWIGLLKRQVHRQTLDLTIRIEHEATLEERQRIAREFHDTLEQNLAGLTLRLDAATSRELEPKLRGFLEGSRNLVSRIQIETRNLVSDLRDFSEEESGLVEMLEEMAGEVSSNVSVVAENIPELPGRTVHHLKMIAQEAVTNAIKHSEAEHIGIELFQEGGRLIMKVSDDGRGFDISSETKGKAGHFGCVGMRERSARLGADIIWRSGVGEGTIVELTMPI